jgi:hypothetical protein
MPRPPRRGQSPPRAGGRRLLRFSCLCGALILSACESTRLGASCGLVRVWADDGPEASAGPVCGAVFASDDPFEAYSLTLSYGELPLERGGAHARYLRLLGRFYAGLPPVPARRPTLAPWWGAGFEVVGLTGPDDDEDVMNTTLGAGVSLLRGGERRASWSVDLAGTVWIPYWVVLFATWPDDVDWGASVGLSAAATFRF